jgi:lipopolysaccharide/colanic/teichoic acid biosynthesis glycosyltransferase
LAKAIRNTTAHYQRDYIGGNHGELLKVRSRAADDQRVIPDIGLSEVSRVTSRRYRLYKRWMDVSLVLATSPLLLALFTVIAVVVRISSKGPIFYKHKRIGLHGRTFTMYKFRTMRVDADRILLQHLHADPAAEREWMLKQKLCDDPRLTPCGRFLRTASLDEFPQLWNVLRGDMSLVGPRPIIHTERERYGERFFFYTAVVPGLTGLWQVSGRCNVSYSARIALDERYVREWSICQDLRILLKTPLTVWRREGAY